MINHRGPDEKNIITYKNFSAGVKRLSIESIKFGKQPIENERYILGFNGELFNYKNLIKKYNFNKKDVRSEIQLILNLWMLKKEKFVNEIKGQYAIFIYDKKKEEIYLFRDPFGIRPVYYYLGQNTFIFSSEIKSIVKTKIQNFSIDNNSLNQICFFWTNIGTQTSIKDVYSLEPGKYLKWNKYDLKTYRHYLFPTFNKKILTAKKKFNLFNAISDAVEGQIHGEVDFGCYLSGGIDSSALAYVLSKKRNLDTFSVKFESNEYDESNFQKLVSKKLKTKHHELTIRNKDIAENFFNVINHAETFLFRTAPVPMYLLSKHVRDLGFKVIYTGEGADEMLFGYDIFFENRIRNLWKKNPSSKKNPELFKKLYYYLPQFKNSRYFEIIKDFYKVNLKKSSIFYSHLVRWQQYNHVSSFFNLNNNQRSTEKLLKKLEKSLPKNFSSLENDHKTQYLEISTLLSNYLLSSQGDRMTMANSVEGRYPFLDEDFVDSVCQVKPSLLAPNIESKKMFRNSFINKLPKEITNRPKVAYQAPEAKCFVNKNFISNDIIELIDNIDDLDLINKNNFLNLIEKFKDKNTSDRMGFRENMALILGLSYLNLKKSIHNWSN